MAPQKLIGTCKKPSKILKLLVTVKKYPKLLWAIQISVTVLHIGGLVYGSLGKHNKLYSSTYANLKPTDCVLIIVDLLRDFLLTLSNTLGFYCFSNSPKLTDMLYSFQNKMSCTGGRSAYVCTMITLYLLISVIIIINFAFANVEIGWSILKHAVPATVEYAIFNFTIFSMLYFALAVRGHLASVNEFLGQRIDPPYFESNSVRISLTATQKYDHPKGAAITCLDNLQYITRHHEYVCDILDMLNEEFKALTVVAITSIAINILWNITMIIESLLGTYRIGLQVATIFLLLLLVAVGQEGLSAWMGEQIEKEGHQTMKICFSLINKLSTNMANKQYSSDIEKQLHLLLDQSKSRKVYLHAGGFFRVDWGIIGMVMSTVTTYSIVIIQFYVTANFG